jgi:hypothetical protein
MSEKPSPALTRKMLMLVTACATVVALALIALPLVVGEPGRKWPDVVLFLGRFHMLVLHIPIGVFVLILLQEIGAMILRRGDARPSRFALALGMISAVVAALAGFLLYHGSGDDYAGNELAERHLWAGMAFAVAAIATWIASLWADAMGANPVWYRLMLFATFGIMTFAGHDGASMTHGRDYLTQYAPTWLSGMLGDEEKPSVPEVVKLVDPVVYTEIVAPIFERRCVACHNAEKSKGKYRMDTYELLLAGGKEGSGMRLGNAADSLLIQRIELPLDDEEHMPPEGKPQVTAAELRVLKWWIDQGADPAKKLSESNVTAEIDAALKEIAGQKEPVAPAYDK